MKVVIATSREWNEFIAEEIRSRHAVEVILITKKEDLTVANLSKIKPDYIFFPHWSYIIAPEIFNTFECVIFHMTDLPFGRGGSPLQNLIARGIYHTMISAIKCVETLDGGPIYLKKPLDLSGSAAEIFNRASKITLEMISEMIQNRPAPVPQTGNAVEFIRRKPRDSNIYGHTNLISIYDYIRMLDAEGYPRAYIENDLIKYEFSDVVWDGNDLVAQVRIKRKQDV